MFVHFISHSTAQTTKHVCLEQQVDRGLEAIAYDLELTDDPEEATEEHAAEVPLLHQPTLIHRSLWYPAGLWKLALRGPQDHWPLPKNETITQIDATAFMFTDIKMDICKPSAQGDQKDTKTLAPTGCRLEPKCPRTTPVSVHP